MGRNSTLFTGQSRDSWNCAQAEAEHSQSRLPQRAGEPLSSQLVQRWKVRGAQELRRTPAEDRQTASRLHATFFLDSSMGPTDKTRFGFRKYLGRDETAPD